MFNNLGLNSNIIIKILRSLFESTLHDLRGWREGYKGERKEGEGRGGDIGR